MKGSPSWKLSKYKRIKTIPSYSIFKIHSEISPYVITNVIFFQVIQQIVIEVLPYSRSLCQMIFHVTLLLNFSLLIFYPDCLQLCTSQTSLIRELSLTFSHSAMIYICKEDFIFFSAFFTHHLLIDFLRILCKYHIKNDINSISKSHVQLFYAA